MSIITKLYKGQYGLVTTYWVWGVLGGLVVLVGSYVAVFIATKNINNEILYNSITNGYALFVAIWTIFISLAIINSSTYQRERGFWGWVASILAVLGIARALYMVAVLVGLASLGWDDVARSVNAENLGLPVEIDEGLVLTRMTADSLDKSLTYELTWDYATLNNNTFDIGLAKESMLESCGEMEDYFERAVEKVIYRYKANDNTTIDVVIFAEDCLK